MKKAILLSMVSLMFIHTSCRELITVLARFTNIDSTDRELKLHFDFRRPGTEEISFVRRIEIYRNDSLICKLVGEAGTGISSWDFPSIPADFFIDTTVSKNEIPKVLKDHEIRFEFAGGVELAGYGSWSYRSKYSEAEQRWLFDERGNQKTRISCNYEPWIGKDIVKIESSEKFLIDDSLFQLTSENGTNIPFQVRYKRNPTGTLALVLDNSIKTGERIWLGFRIDSERYYTEVVKVPDKSVIGVAGKFSDL